MRYKNSLEIYDEEIRNKGYYVPRLSFQDETNLQYMTMVVTTLSQVLNEPLMLMDYFNIGFMYDRWIARRDYKRNEKELREFLQFWGFPFKLDNKELFIERKSGSA